MLPIGGVKEKTIGARRSGITTLIFPRNNKKDWDELPAFITEGMTAHFVEWYDEVFEVAFSPEVVKRAREARAVTRAAAISEFEIEKKERAAAAAAAPAVVEPSQKSADSEAKKSGDSAAAEEKPKRKPTFLVTPRWATVGTPPAALEQEWADLGADSPFTIPASPVAVGSATPAPAAAPVAARSREL